jgi:predicted esterase
MQPHFGSTIVYAGADLASAPATMILVHGRNGSPENILSVFKRLARPQIAAIAPAANGGTWYPYNFMVPREQNEPGITSALFVLESLVSDLRDRGIPSHKIILAGFSQGACLSAEFALRHPRKYGGVMALSGGLIGAPGTTWNDLHGSLAGVRVFLGCSDVDPYIPVERVLESEVIFRRMAATVERRLYEGMAHIVNDDEIEVVRGVIDEVIASPT